MDTDQTQGHPEPSASELLAKYLRRPSVLLPLLGLVTFVVYSGSLSFDFVWDDWPQIVEQSDHPNMEQSPARVWQ